MMGLSGFNSDDDASDEDIPGPAGARKVYFSRWAPEVRALPPKVYDVGRREGARCTLLAGRLRV